MAKEKESNKFVDISKKIHEAISTTANNGAIERLVQRKAEEEIERRSIILEKGLLLFNTTEKELKKCVEDVVTHVAVEGEETHVEQKSFSDARFKERANLKKRLADIDVALMLAFGDNQDYSKLEELIKKNPVKEKGNKNSEGGDQ